MGTFLQDIRYALRRIVQNPGFSAIAVLTLALGIGATSTIFSVVNAVLLRPLPFRDPQGLITVSQQSTGTQTAGVHMSFTKYEAIRDQAQSLEGLAVYYPLSPSLGGESEPEQVAAARVTGDLFGLLGVTPRLGRVFQAAEMAPGGVDVAVLTDGLWQRRFGGDPAVVGRAIRLDGKDVTVVGILPPTFRFPLQLPEPQVWLPRVSEPDSMTPAQVHSGGAYLWLVARLRPGRTIAQAQAELDTINARYRQQYGSYVDATRFQLQAQALEESLVGTARQPLGILLAAVGFVLLIGCTNVASLQLARGSTRVGEMAVRKALGASRARLVGQLLVESLALSLAGGVLGVLLAMAAVPVMQHATTGALPRLEETRMDGSVLLFSLLLCGVSALAFGVVPALHASRGDLQTGLRQGGRGSSDGAARRRLRVLFVGEVAVALVLLTGAGLLIRTLAGYFSIDPGFRAQGVVAIPIALPTNRYPEPPRQAEFFRQLLDRTGALPGVKAAAAIDYVPLGGTFRLVFFCPEGRVCEGVGKDPVILQHQVTPDYFAATRTRILRGRAFTATDTALSRPVVIVNETTARLHWPGADPIGKHLANSRDNVPREVVGLAADVKFRSLALPSIEEMYLPLAQSPWPSMALLVRSEADPWPLVAGVRQELARLDPDIAVSRIQTLEDIVGGSVARTHLVERVVAAFAMLALLLASIGIYGVMSYSVAQRTREFAVRMALGASPRDIMRLVLGEGLGLTVAGMGVGFAAALALTRLIARFLFGVSATDPVTFGSALVVLAATALLASFVPARRGMRLSPVRALRDA